MEIINRHKTLFEDEECITVNENSFHYDNQIETAVEAWPPEKKDKIVKAIRDFFGEFVDPFWDNDTIKDYKKMDKELRENVAQIVETLDLLEWEYSRTEWGEFAPDDSSGMCNTKYIAKYENGQFEYDFEEEDF